MQYNKKKLGWNRFQILQEQGGNILQLATLMFIPSSPCSEYHVVKENKSAPTVLRLYFGLWFQSRAEQIKQQEVKQEVAMQQRKEQLESMR